MGWNKPFIVKLLELLIFCWRFSCRYNMVDFYGPNSKPVFLEEISAWSWLLEVWNIFQILSCLLVLQFAWTNLMHVCSLLTFMVASVTGFKFSLKSSLNNWVTPQVKALCVFLFPSQRSGRVVFFNRLFYWGWRATSH